MTKKFDLSEFTKYCRTLNESKQDDVKNITLALNYLTSEDAEIVTAYIDENGPDYCMGQIHTSYFTIKLPKDPTKKSACYEYLIWGFSKSFGIPRCKHLNYEASQGVRFCRVCNRVFTDEGTWVEAVDNRSSAHMNFSREDDQELVTVVLL